MRILLSAYSCEPNRGSEPGLGWHTAVELGRDHDVWVVTKERHRGPIERELARRPQPRVRFVFHDLPAPLRWGGAGGTRTQVHYYLWQYSVYPAARRLCREVGFDVACHVTFGRSWSPSLFALLPVPFVWAGLGGGEVVPRAMRRCLRPAGRLAEWAKEATFALCHLDPLVHLTARRAALILANSQSTVDRLGGFTRGRVGYMETAVVDRETVAMIDGLEEPAPRGEGDPVCFATMTRLEAWKGVHLGLMAFQRLGDPRARYLIVGEGPERRPLERLAQHLGVAHQVEFMGNPSRAEWMRLMKQCHALVHPVLASPFNTIALEAMLCARPVVCFRTPYMAEKLGEDTGYLVDGPRPQAAVNGLAEAMRRVAERPAEARERGARGRDRALRLFTWESRIERLNRHLRDAVGADAPAPRGDGRAEGFVRPAHPSIARSSRYDSAAVAADSGIVSTHAISTFRATPQRTADTRRGAPTPMRPAERTCVVLVYWDASRREAPPPVMGAPPAEPTARRGGRTRRAGGDDGGVLVGGHRRGLRRAAVQPAATAGPSAGDGAA